MTRCDKCFKVYEDDETVWFTTISGREVCEDCVKSD